MWHHCRFTLEVTSFSDVPCSFVANLMSFETHLFDKMFDWAATSSHTPHTVQTHHSMFHSQQQISFIQSFAVLNKYQLSSSCSKT